MSHDVTHRLTTLSFFTKSRAPISCYLSDGASGVSAIIKPYAIFVLLSGPCRDLHPKSLFLLPDSNWGPLRHETLSL